MIPLEVAVSADHLNEHDELIKLFHSTKILTTNYQNKFYTKSQLRSQEVQELLNKAENLLEEKKGFECPIYIFEKLKVNNWTHK
jgi:hypothetical protein